MWLRFVKSHHDDEEAELFPKVEEVLGSKEIWQETHQEHGMSHSSYVRIWDQQLIGTQNPS